MPKQISEDIGDLIEEMRRGKKFGPDRIAGELLLIDIKVSSSTVHRELVRRGINKLRNIDAPTGEDKVKPIRYEHKAPGDMVHVDVKKIGKIPDGGGWWAHGRESEKALQSRRKANKRPGYTYVHACVDDNSRIAYVECHDNERATTACEFFERAVIFYRLFGVEIRSVLTDNGSCYISGLWKGMCADLHIKHRRTKRQTPKTNGKVERFNRTMKDEWMYVRVYTSEEERRAAMTPFLNYYNFDRPHTAIGNRPPMSRAPQPGPRLIAGEAIVAPPTRGQMVLELTHDNNVSG